MRSISVALMILLASCGTAAPRATHASDPERAQLVARLCQPLPARAFDCTVGWPASVGPSRRDAVLSASEASLWAGAAGVRAFAVCVDRRSSDGPGARTVVLLVDTSAGSVEEIAERLPEGVRWTETCDDEADDCRHYLAHGDGDRLVLTRGVARPFATDQNVAHLACGAVADGAEEAHARLDEEDALVREIHVQSGGIAITTRRPGGRGGADRLHRTWTELELAASDERLEHEAEARSAAIRRPMDPEEVDVTSTTALDAQLHARQRQLTRDHSTESARALARLAARGFAAHPSRPDLAIVSIDAALSAHEVELARTVLASLIATVGEDDPGARDLAITVDAIAGDASSLAARVAAIAPALPSEDARRVAEALATEVARHPLEQEASAPAMLSALIAAARAGHVVMTRRASATLTPARGAAWAIQALSGGAGSRVVAMCSDAVLPTAIGGRSTSRGGATVFAALDRCAAVVLPSDARFEVGTLAGGLVQTARGATTILVEIGGELVGVGGTIDADGALHVDRSTLSLVHADLARAAREVVLPLDALGSRVFPPPTLAIALPEARRSASLAASRGIEGVDCTRSATGLSCSLESYESVERLAETAYAVFGAR